MNGNRHGLPTKQSSRDSSVPSRHLSLLCVQHVLQSCRTALQRIVPSSPSKGYLGQLYRSAVMSTDKSENDNEPSPPAQDNEKV